MATRRRGSDPFVHPCTGQLTKRCSKCLRILPVESFGADARRKDGYRPQCSPCGRAANRAHYEANKEAAYARTSAWKRSPIGIQSSQAASRAWRAGNPDLVKARKRAEYQANREETIAMFRDMAFQRKYGISLAERDAMAEVQGHRCAICLTHESELPKRLAVDHDHTSGAIRSLLCQACNLGLGFFRDAPELLERAAAYLRVSGHQSNKAVTFHGA